LKIPHVAMIGLGARDSLRLEAGLCLYGSDLDETTSPVEAQLEWTVPASRRRGGARAGGFPGADRILEQLETGAPRHRVGLRPEGRAPIRQGTQLFSDRQSAAAIGTVTSGGFGPSVNAPIAMGYVAPLLSEGAVVFAELRGERQPVRIARLPFITPRYKR
jgi:aminomethyltransferase